MARKRDTGPKLTKEERREAWKHVRQIFAFLAPYRFRLIFSGICSLVSIGFSLCFPYLVGHLLDASIPSVKEAGPGAWNPSIDTVALVLLACLAAQAAFSFVASIGFNRAGEYAVVDLRRSIFGRLLTLPMAFFAEKRVGDLASRMTSDLGIVQETFTGTISQALRQATLLLGGIGLIAATSFRLSAVMISTFPVLIVMAILIGRSIRKMSRRAQERLAESATVVEETLQGISSVKAFANEPLEMRRYGRALEGFLEVVMRTVRFRAALVSFVIFGIFGSIILVLWYGARLMEQGHLTHGELTRFILYTTFVGGAVVSFADVFGRVNKMLGAASRVQGLLVEEPERGAGDGGAAEGLRLRGDVAFRDVRFAYPGRRDIEVLRGVDLQARAGERIALVGPSGAGKSTLVSLLLRFYEPVSGTLLIDGRPAGEYPLPALRGAMAIVPQEVLLFGGTIRENIAYGKPGAGEAEIIAAARRAHCDEFIRAFPEGYETVVGERGVKLSGGQRQRVAIARALLRDPSILILDEATGSLDSESERLVQTAIDALLEGRTAFIIAHRLATVRGADRIYVLDQGRVVESGTHEELMARDGGLYRKLSEMQYFDAADRAG